MKSYQNMIDEVKNLICYDRKEDHFAVIGNNSSGKSELLRQIIDADSERNCYFVDSVNRYFDSSRVELLPKSEMDSFWDEKNVLERRISPEFFNLQDSFAVLGSIEFLYYRYKDVVERYFHQLTGQILEIKRVKLEAGLVMNQVLIDGIEVQLSSGYQAILRILMEMCYYKETLAFHKKKYGTVIIDELDEYLSPGMCSKIYPFLQKKFDEFYFIITTHSIDIIKSLEKTHLIVLEGQCYEFYPDTLLNQTVEIEDIFQNIFFADKMQYPSGDGEIEKALRVLLNRKIADMWNEECQYMLDQIKERELLPHQQLICKHIEGWKK